MVPDRASSGEHCYAKHCYRPCIADIKHCYRPVLQTDNIVIETLLRTQHIYISLFVKQCNGPEAEPGQTSTREHLDYVLFVSYVFKSYSFVYISLISSFIKEDTLARNNVMGFGCIQA